MPVCSITIHPSAKHALECGSAPDCHEGNWAAPGSHGHGSSPRDAGGSSSQAVFVWMEAVLEGSYHAVPCL